MADSGEFKLHSPGMINRNGRFLSKKETIEDPAKTTKRILGYLGSKKISLILIFVLAIISTLTSILGTRINGYTVDHFIQTKDMRGLALICLVLAIIYLTNVIAVFFQNRISVNISQLTSSNIRKDLFLNIQGLPLKYFDTHASGDIMSRLTNDVDNISMTLSQSTATFFSGLINILGMLIAMLILSPVLTLIIVVTIPIMMISTRLLVSKTQPFFIKQQRELGNLNGYIEEIMSAQKTVILFSEEQKVKDEFSDINQRLSHSSIFAQSLSGILGPLNNFINNISYLLAAVLGGYLIIMEKGGITAGIILTFVIYMRNFTRPINDILNIFNTIQSALAGAERVFQIIDESKESNSPDAIEIDKIEGHIKFENVDFSYGKEKKILKNLNLEAPKGSLIAIVGPTGSGKTTIINLLTKFYDIDQGNIAIDQNNIHNLTFQSLRKNISIVLQDTFLFSETVMENIRYGNINASDEQVIAAAKLANAHNFIIQFPNSYETVLSDNGNDLSHGQRQLIAIARAILADSSILILDEATSSIDTNTEFEIQRALYHLMKDKTTFVIAHRLSTIKNADNIIFLNNGTIIESGTHNQLLQKNGAYAELYNSQFKFS